MGRNYKQGLCFHCSTHFTNHYSTHLRLVSFLRAFTSLMVTTYNSGHSPSCGFPNCPHAVVTAILLWLTNQFKMTMMDITPAAALLCRLFTDKLTQVKIQVKVMLQPTVQAPIGDTWPDFYYCQTVAGLLMWVPIRGRVYNLQLLLGLAITITSQVWVLQYR
jgi:hypothetical protein